MVNKTISFPFLEKGVPKIQLGSKFEPARFKEAVVLNCSVSYENTKSHEFRLTMSWKKDGKTLAAKTYEYKRGTITEKILYSFVITSHTDGGDYTCSWELTKQKNSISRKSDVNLQSKLLCSITAIIVLLLVV